MLLSSYSAVTFLLETKIYWSSTRKEYNIISCQIFLKLNSLICSCLNVKLFLCGLLSAVILDSDSCDQKKKEWICTSNVWVFAYENKFFFTSCVLSPKICKQTFGVTFCIFCIYDWQKIVTRSMSCFLLVYFYRDEAQLYVIAPELC